MNQKESNLKLQDGNFSFYIETKKRIIIACGNNSHFECNGENVGTQLYTNTHFHDENLNLIFPPYEEDIPYSLISN